MKLPLTLSAIAVMTAILLVVNIAYAQQGIGGPATELEIAQLPPYCQAQLRGDRAQISLWAQRVGGREVWVHITHFCNGLVYFQRAGTSFDQRERRRYLGRTISAMDYVLQRWPNHSPLYQEAETYKTQAQTLLDLF